MAQIVDSAVAEVKGATRYYAAWFFLGIQDIRLRYRRSTLGPWWLTISAAILVGTLGVIYSHIFKMDYKTYVPFFAVGYVLWTFIAAEINEATTAFTQFERAIRQVNIPFSVYLLRVWWRNLIIFAHTAVVAVLALFVVGRGLSMVAVLAIPGLILIALGCLFASTVVAIFCTRFRDMAPIVSNLMQVLFFVSPILWDPTLLGEQRWLAELNPVYHWIEVVRAPLLGSAPSIATWLWVVASVLVLAGMATFVLGRYRSRIAYWL